MENVKYIPGDLVKIYGDICRVKGVRKKDNSLTPCLIEAKVVSDTEDIVRAVDASSIEPIPITPQILMDNGWKLIQQGVDDEGFEYGKYFKDYSFPTLIFYPHIRGQAQNMSALINGKDIKSNLLYCHQLQHLLFGLGLPSELKV